MFLQGKIWIRVLGILMFALANSGSIMGEEYTLLSPDQKLKVRFSRTDEGSFEYKFLMGMKCRRELHCPAICMGNIIPKL